MILEKVQKVLDQALHPEGILVFWNRRSDVAGKRNKEYVVYTQDGAPAYMIADDRPLVRTPEITVLYYYDTLFESSRAGRTRVQKRATGIVEAMEAAGFESETGIMFTGDIDGVGMSTAVMEFSFLEVE